MKFGVILPQGWRGDLDGRDFETVVRVALRAEELGFDSVWLYDHLQTRDGDPQPVLECWTTLAALARETSRVRLGQIVTCALYRNPGLLAQMASTVDAASGDRVFLGVGAGWDEREYVDFGYADELPPVRARLAHLEHTLVRRCARGAARGRSSSAAPARRCCCAWSRSTPTRAISPTRSTRRSTATSSTSCARTAKHVGRDEREILKTASFTVREDDDVDFDAIAAAGIEYFIVYLDPPTDLNVLERFAQRCLTP